MTQDSRSASPGRDCPDPGLIAAHAERRLTGAEAARMDEHIAGCADCYDTFSETVRFGLAEAPRFVRRSTVWATAGLATAAAVLVTLGAWFSRDRTAPVPVSLVAELAEAMGNRRFVAPRLTGGFRHGRLITLRSGDTPQGLDAQSPAVLGAVARIRERAEADTSPEALGALGVTYLVSGDAAAAVRALESASAQKPDEARLLSDLAAAYLVRADQADEPADIPKALASAERAVALADAPAEAWFNRALALERLHLVDAARTAWGDYLQRDSSSGWAEEARQHLEALPRERKSSAEEERARIRAALAEGSTAADRLADETPHLLREYFDDELLPAWAEAHLVGHPDASVYRERARLVGEALLRTTSDAMARDTAQALAEPLASGAARDPLRAQALGYRALREGRRLYDRQEPSCGESREAARALQAGGSPHASWARLQVVIACLYPSEPGAALVELQELEAVCQARRYVQVLGRVRWIQGLIHGLRGELTATLASYRAARASFQTSHDLESEATIAQLLTECLQLLGETHGAWRDRQRGLALLAQVRSLRRRHNMLAKTVAACLDERLPRTALHFVTALVDTAVHWSRPVAIGEALIRRAAIHHQLGADGLAANDLLHSRRWTAAISDERLARGQRAEADAVEGEILAPAQAERAVDALTNAIDYFKAVAPVRVPVLHLRRAEAQTALGLHERAEAELSAGLSAMELGRTSVEDPALQTYFFDQSQPLFDEMVRLQVTKRRDPERALEFVERGRGRQLLDSLAASAARSAAAGPGSGTHARVDPDVLRRELPDGLTLVYYAALEETLFSWALARDGSHFVESPMPAAELSRLVAAYRSGLERRAPLPAVHRTASRLFDALVRPLLPFIASQRALVFIPDGVLQNVAFAALWDRQTEHYLAEDYLVGLAPSGTVFIRASAAAAAAPRGRAPGALIVGNPRLDRRIWVGFPDLPGAESEAAEIARLYPGSELLTGTDATREAFLAGARGSQVVHFAGHAVASPDARAAGRLLFAPDPRGDDSGALSTHELAGRDFRRTRVVVLAACRTAAGAVSRVEGSLSLCRPFLAAGVPDVVASLWDVDDSVSRRFFVAFHRGLSAGEGALPALRKAQVGFLRDRDASLAHPASWAAFICMGGLDPQSLSKGELS